MKYLAFVLFISFFVFSGCKDNPETIVPHATTVIKITTAVNYDLYDVAFVNPTTGFIVGDSGTILKTTNSGASWFPLNSGVNLNLQCVRVINADTILVGGVNVFLKTTNGGSTWDSIEPHYNIHDIYVAPNGNCIALGNGVGIFFFYSTDFGSSWSYSFKENLNNLVWGDGALSSYLQLSVSTIVVSQLFMGYNQGSCSIYRSTDGGNSFYRCFAFPNEYGNGMVLSLLTLDNTNVYAVGQFGAIAHSGDAGASWSMLSTKPDTNVFTYSSITGISNQSLFVCGDRGTILTTTDGGQNWTKLSPSTNYALLRITYVRNSSYLIAVGRGGVILKINI